LGGLAVKCGVLVAVEVDGFWIDEGEQLFVVAASRVCDHLGDVARSVHGPFELFRQLFLSRLPVELAAHEDLGPFVISRCRNQQFGIAYRRRLGSDCGVHLLDDELAGEAPKIGRIAVRERPYRLDQSDRAFLD
jgi:hypothetical protein